MKLCPEQESCMDYARKDNLPLNHDVRNKYKCSRWVKEECDLLQGQSCNLAKIKRIKGG